MQMFEAKSQNAQFEFSTNYLHFILKKAAWACGEVQRRNKKIEELMTSYKSWSLNWVGGIETVHYSSC